MEKSEEINSYWNFFFLSVEEGEEGEGEGGGIIVLGNSDCFLEEGDRLSDECHTLAILMYSRFFRILEHETTFTLENFRHSNFQVVSIHV